MASPLSPSTPKTQTGTEWISLSQKKVASFLIILAVLSTVFLFSIWYSSHSLALRSTNEALRKNPLLTDLNVSLIAKIYDENFTYASFTQDLDHNSTSEIELCDLAMGKWVTEIREPIYTNVTCPSIPDFKNCQKYGKDPGYLYWRWKPDGCDLPRYEPERFLNFVRGKKMAFIGDSLARNQFDSLLCLLSQVETPIEIYRDMFDKFRTMHFPSSNFTLMVMWSEFYVQGIPVIVNGTTTASFNIHLDKINTNWTSQLPSLNYAIISGGNWFFRINYLYENDELIGCVNCREENVKDYGISYAIRRVVRKALESINECENCDGLVTFLRTYTPHHFENGSWFSGGYCNRTHLLAESEIDMNTIEWEIKKIQNKEINKIREVNEGGNENKKSFGVMDVTKAMMIRADGHPGANYDKRWVRNANDCLHWCLPGPVDMWNDMLLFNLMKSSSVD
ncbi:hypothetical protein LUZ60_000306 [Juncus effusus]|nr:hypothetical protein LUZ60_000306 [Juncus effusus]